MVGNNEKITKKLGGITGKGFLPGKSGNPSGRPKNTLKDYVREKFIKMTEKEKEEWLRKNRVSADLQWRMGEGNPTSEIEGNPDKPIIIQVAKEILEKNNVSTSGTSDNSERSA